MLLVTTNLEYKSDQAVLAGLQIASALKTSCEIVHCVEPPPFPHFFGELELQAELSLAKQRFETQLERIGVPSGTELTLLTGNPSTEIIEHIKTLAPETVILGPHRPRIIFDDLMGSVSDKVIRSVDAPCLKVSAPFNIPPRKILMCTDFSPASSFALKQAVAWISKFKTPSPVILEILHVHAFATASGRALGPVAFDKFLVEMASALEGNDQIKVRTRVVSAPTVIEGIQRAAGEMKADLLVLGTHGHNALVRFLIGSVTSQSVRRLAFPQLLIPPPNH